MNKPPAPTECPICHRVESSVVCSLCKTEKHIGDRIVGLACYAIGAVFIALMAIGAA